MGCALEHPHTHAACHTHAHTQTHSRWGAAKRSTLKTHFTVRAVGVTCVKVGRNLVRKWLKLSPKLGTTCSLRLAVAADAICQQLVDSLVNWEGEERERERQTYWNFYWLNSQRHTSFSGYVGYVGHAGRRKSYYGSNMPQLATLLTLLQQMSNKFPTTTTAEVAATATVAATTAAAATDDSGNNGREIRQQAFSKIFTVWKL